MSIQAINQARLATQRPSATMTRRARLGHPLVVLVATLLFVYAYTPPRWQDWNQNSRFDLTRAIVERHTFRIDAYATNTGDYATIDGHVYSDKAPGLALMAVPVYGVTRALRPLGIDWLTRRLSHNSAFVQTLTPGGAGVSDDRAFAAVALYLATLCCVALPAAIMAGLLAAIVRQLTGCQTAGIASALIIAIATPVFAYAQAFYGHVPAAACLVAALALIVLRKADLSNARLLGIGALLAWAFVLEYPAALAGLPLALWALRIAGRRAVRYGTLGALPPFFVLALVDLIAFRTIVPIGYAHSTLWQSQHDVGFMSLTYPHWDAIWGLSGSGFRGLFAYAPVLVLAAPGTLIALRMEAQRAATIVAISGFMAMFLFAASSGMWWGGFAVGPRYMLPGVPLLALPLGAIIARWNALPLRARAWRLGLVAALSAVSASLVWATTFAGQQFPPDTTRSPLSDYVAPALWRGDIARNLGMAAHLSGLVSLLPLVVVVLVGVASIGLRLASRQQVSA